MSTSHWEDGEDNSLTRLALLPTDCEDSKAIVRPVGSVQAGGASLAPGKLGRPPWYLLERWEEICQEGVLSLWAFHSRGSCADDTRSASARLSTGSCVMVALLNLDIIRILRHDGEHVFL